uniref:CCHC-type domain-containing protein n=1 Tax=Maylandia zebra TaxID=106582 RepID=A0A3P9BL11_9CICH
MTERSSQVDSADSAPWRRELSLQAALLERHENMLQHFSKEQSALIQVVTELKGMLLSPPGAAGGPLPVPPPINVAAAFPEKFSGDLDKSRGFLMQCALTFRQQPQAYATDCSKITLMVELLTGRALQWAQAVLNSQPQISYTDFLSKFRSVFDKGTNPDSAAHRMFVLKQGRRSVADFSVDFWILAEETGWEETALRGAFLNSLNEGLKRELASKELPKTLSALINLCIKLDDHLREFSKRTSGGAGWRTGLPALEWKGTDPRSAEEEEQPMQLGGARLSSTDWRKRRQTGECFACGKKGHFADACPSRGNDQPAP